MQEKTKAGLWYSKRGADLQAQHGAACHGSAHALPGQRVDQQPRTSYDIQLQSGRNISWVPALALLQLLVVLVRLHGSNGCMPTRHWGVVLGQSIQLGMAWRHGKKTHFELGGRKGWQVDTNRPADKDATDKLHMAVIDHQRQCEDEPGRKQTLAWGDNDENCGSILYIISQKQVLTMK